MVASYQEQSSILQKEEEEIKNISVKCVLDLYPFLRERIEIFPLETGEDERIFLFRQKELVDTAFLLLDQRPKIDSKGNICFRLPSLKIERASIEKKFKVVCLGSCCESETRRNKRNEFKKLLQQVCVQNGIICLIARKGEDEGYGDLSGLELVDVTNRKKVEEKIKPLESYKTEMYVRPVKQGDTYDVFFK